MIEETYQQLMTARAEQDWSAEPIPEPSQVIVLTGEPEAPPADERLMMTHYVGDDCPGGHHDDPDAARMNAEATDAEINNFVGELVEYAPIDAEWLNTFFPEGEPYTHYYDNGVQVSLPAECCTDVALLQEAFARAGGQ